MLNRNCEYKVGFVVCFYGVQIVLCAGWAILNRDTEPADGVFFVRDPAGDCQIIYLVHWTMIYYFAYPPEQMEFLTNVRLV